jgi:hypothetical protein
MTTWLDAEGRLFNPNPTLREVALSAGRVCIVIDNVLANPDGLRAWAATQHFAPPVGYPYPGLVCDVVGDIPARVADYFALHVRKRLGARRTASLATRLSMVTQAPGQLAPIQWLCHRDRLVHDSSDTLFAASVLYLFHEPALGGTSFYVPRQSPAQTEQLVADSGALSTAEFSARYGLQPGYITGSNDYFERVAKVPAAWNRIIFYDGGQFHSGDIDDPQLMHPDPLRGRLTFNSFITCRKGAS